MLPMFWPPVREDVHISSQFLWRSYTNLWYFVPGRKVLHKLTIRVVAFRCRRGMSSLVQSVHSVIMCKYQLFSGSLSPMSTQTRSIAFSSVYLSESDFTSVVLKSAFLPSASCLCFGIYPIDAWYDKDSIYRNQWNGKRFLQLTAFLRSLTSLAVIHRLKVLLAFCSSYLVLFLVTGCFLK